MKTITKRLMALGLAGVMASSFAGCNKSLSATSYEEVDSNDISLVNENGEDLTVLTLVSKANDIAIDEKYGYIHNEKFFDVLNSNREYNLNNLATKYDIYSCKYVDILSDEDYNYITNLNCVNYDYLNKMSDEIYSWYNRTTGSWELSIAAIGYQYNFSENMNFEQLNQGDYVIDNNSQNTGMVKVLSLNNKNQ